MAAEGNYTLARLLAEASQGNPGALTVLIEMYKQEPDLAITIGQAIIKTNSKACVLWLVYSDLCKGDLKETMMHLAKWGIAAVFKGETLGKYFGAQDLVISDAARYYS